MTKPRLALIGTGGPIAGAASAASVSTDYKPASLSLAAVVDTVPELRQRYDIEVTQPMQLASYDVRPEHWCDLQAAVMQAVNNPDVVGIVVTHGTDTLEETATFLHLSVDSDKPIVVVGAMRPATAYSADGPANLLDACSVAACPGARGRGTLVVMNGRIHSGLWVGKRQPPGPGWTSPWPMPGWTKPPCAPLWPPERGALCMPVWAMPTRQRPTALSSSHCPRKACWWRVAPASSRAV